MKTHPKAISRRSVVLAAAGTAINVGCTRKMTVTQSGPKSAVFIGRVPSYSDDLASMIEAGIRASGLNARDKRVLLKPNLVEFDKCTAINTDPHVVAAAYEVFRKLGAQVLIAEGPGHRRDTFGLAEEAGYRQAIPRLEDVFADLNTDDTTAVGDFAGEKQFYFPNTVLGADLIVSLAKMKTHHWAGATLSMKNLFGLVPGCIYGWPKNKLHFIGIPKSIAGLNRKFRNTFAIVDGIVGMEGNGPIQGTPKACGVLVMGADLPAVDATCCRIMGIDPDRVSYLQLAQDLGNTAGEQIEQRGERIDTVSTDFELFGEFQSIRLRRG